MAVVVHIWGLVRTVLAYPTSSAHVINSGITLLALDSADALLALFFALFKLTNTIDAKMPMMAMTIKSSIRVKPLYIFVFILTPPLVLEAARAPLTSIANAEPLLDFYFI
ncbi:MAG: hypothetical protein A3J63_02180 [Candidatus Moranbacteria bacterium RIFCSPHIGHO2_02_FULL_40_12b]|nr:MAG: hypothetical protein A3J63_02180 [Candidatus Moranbacteria bacterium RIFCSPHIGHO2_02_FULL_40_12b]